MDSVRYVDVFSGTPFKGNALAVFHGADGLSDEQMADPLWNRGTLSRAQMELVAGRLSLIRECFF